MPRKSEITRPSSSMVPKSTLKRRHTYTTSDTISDLFGFSMHGVDPTTEYFDQLLASPTPNDMYLDSFHGDDTLSNAVGSLPLLSLDEEKEDEEVSTSSTRKSLKRTKSIKKKKKKRNSKRLSSDSVSSKKSTDSKSKSSRSSTKSKKSKTPEDKSFAAMLQKLEEYEASLQEERRQLQKERDEITLERETLELKMFELETRLDELEDGNHCLAPSSSHINKDALCIENAILQRRLKRQEGIILELSSSEKKTEQSKEVSSLKKELRKAKELNAKNEKIIKGQKLTIKRMRKEASSSKKKTSRETNPVSDDESFSLFSIEISKFDDDDDGSYTTFAESNFEDSLNSLQLTNTQTKKPVRKIERTKSLDRIKNWVKRGKTRSERQIPRRRFITPEEAKLSHLIDSI